MRLVLIIGGGVLAYLAYQEFLLRRGIGPDLIHIPGASGVEQSPVGEFLEDEIDPSIPEEFRNG